MNPGDVDGQTRFGLAKDDRLLAARQHSAHIRLAAQQ
jgi:hypothetical protein